MRLAIKWGLEAADEDTSFVAAWQTRATRLPPERLAAVVVGGVRLLRSWPEGLRDWALTQGDPNGTARTTSLRRRARRMAIGDGGYSARFDVVQEALPPDTLLDAHAFPDGRRTYSSREVRLRLPQVGAHIMAIRATGLIPFTVHRHRGERTYRYCADSVDAVAARAADAVSIGSAQRSLGLPVYALEQFFDAGLLQRLNDPTLRILLRRPMTVASALERLQVRLAAAASKRRMPMDALPIGQESRRIGGGPKPWDEIYAAMLAGEVPFWIDGGPHVDHVMVELGSLDRFMGLPLSKCAKTASSCAAEIDTNDAAEMLNVIPATIRRLRVEGILSDRTGPRARLSQRDEVEALAREYISAAELARLARTSAVRVNVALTDAKVDRLVEGVWSRAEALEAMSINGTTTVTKRRPEGARLTGLHRP